MTTSKNKFKYILLYFAIIILAIFQFVLHRDIVFMMDDNWYSTNLVTGQPLSGLADVYHSQIWHFHNWGGRVITHGLLQILLMGGELLCDIANLLCTLLLAFLICRIAGKRQPYWFLIAFSLIIFLNPNIKMSMFWQSGSVNYVYSSTWILLYLGIFLAHMCSPESKHFPLINFYMPLLGLITGWSNENMGPSGFIFSLLVIFCLIKIQNKKPPLWMITGSLFCLLGSILVILAPGNFVRVSCIPETSFGQTLYERMLSMLCAGTDFLFPTVLILVSLLLVNVVFFEYKIQTHEILLLIHAVLSYGAMVLSPHYPDRSTFGTMIVCIILIIPLLDNLLNHCKNKKQCSHIFALIFWSYAIYKVLFEIYIMQSI